MRACQCVAAASLSFLALAGCGGSSPPTAAGPVPAAVSITGTVSARIGGQPIDGSTITFTGWGVQSARVDGGRFSIDLPPGVYGVTIDGPSHVQHKVGVVQVTEGTSLRFTVLRWGPTAFGADYDETFHRFFHQVARVSSQAITNIRKWVVPVSGIYVVDDAIPAEQFATVRSVIDELNEGEIAALWCRSASFAVSTGPEVTGNVDGRIVVRPNWNGSATGTLGSGPIRFGVVTVNVFRQGDQRLNTRGELKGALLHEFYHVAFGYHLCGGNLGPNPFGFSQQNCPYPDSSMANRGPQIERLSPQDRLAACLVYDDDTHIGNLFPDINLRYQ